MSDTFYETVIHFWSQESPEGTELYDLVAGVAHGNAVAVVSPERHLTAEEYQRVVAGAAWQEPVPVQPGPRGQTLYRRTLIVLTPFNPEGQMFDELMFDARSTLIGPTTRTLSREQAEQHEDFADVQEPFDGFFRRSEATKDSPSPQLQIIWLSRK
ncbi:hypothetical protein E5F05_06920 [Deinococcus metallilatus]|uniref:Uncharacterized protein n=1 Tax=Deinococcus metallilatus TaxID=1211322 RepID=A0AAJ5FAL1_9DEIO|nr:hypothetical protein [Deinococcus metallilatus]MBB5294678.1 hypothetical protein [Deinococcus metallilatus]QBY07712.1 hypothetical protein E5F05_06920 [Deinococcus metallilatus]RXJ14128.1 hypothetical protein ERJ73_05755 [Deinococcus metallilatus]TLK30093.1 hypothetical protein FCS05_06070 [Deinococcus metallilatus]GMA15895.1 hypothetical protein GCM10025871_22260 [Deinococcus metallilatus]